MCINESSSNRFKKFDGEGSGQISAARNDGNRIAGGAAGVDRSAREYAEAQGIKLIEFLPDHEKRGRSAPLYRNIAIIEYSDMVLAFWDGKSSGTAHVITNCKKTGVPVEVFIFDGGIYFKKST